MVNNISNLQFLGITENTNKSAESFESWLNEKVKTNKDYKISSIKYHTKSKYPIFLQIKSKSRFI